MAPIFPAPWRSWTGQSLFAMGNSVNVILVKVYQLFGADEVADRIQSLVPYEARSWSREFGLMIEDGRVHHVDKYEHRRKLLSSLKGG